MNVAEQIVAKAFIDPTGAVHRVVPDHQTFAWNYLGPKITRRMKTKGQAEDVLKKRGFIRVQIYSEKGLALEGLRDYLNRNGQFILEVLPDPRRVYISSWPDGKTDYYTGQTLDGIGWDALAAARKRKTQFAALLRQVSEVSVDDTLTLADRWARRQRIVIGVYKPEEFRNTLLQIFTRAPQGRIVDVTLELEKAIGDEFASQRAEPNLSRAQTISVLNELAQAHPGYKGVFEKWIAKIDW